MAVYQVKPGDTLFAIAQRFLGDGHLYSNLLSINPQIVDADLIHVGDLINLPDSVSVSSQEDVATGDEEADSGDMNKQIILIALLAAGAAGIWYFMNNQKVRSNPEADEEDEEAEEVEEVEEDEEDEEDED